MTQERLAELAGLSVRAVGDLERGVTSSPQARSVRRLCAALGLTEHDRRLLTAAAESRPAASRSPAAAAGTAGPPLRARCELPADLGILAGRADACAAMLDLLTARSAHVGSASAPALANVVGPAGVGKTTIAVHVAHRIRPRFPDGQLHIDFAAGGASVADPAAISARILRSLGVNDPPRAAEERAALVRAELVAKAVLLVLDGASESTNVPLLLPAGGRSAVIVTSRFPLAAIARSNVVELKTLSHDVAVQLLDHELGGGHVTMGPSAAKEIVDYCEGLPLAIRAAALRFAHHGRGPLSSLVRQLQNERRPLDLLEYGNLSTRAALAADYQRLGPREQLAVRLLATQPRSPFGLDEFARIIAAPAGEAAPVLDRLVRYQFLDVIGARRYRLRGLARSYARELSEPGQEQGIELRAGDSTAGGF